MSNRSSVRAIFARAGFTDETVISDRTWNGNQSWWRERIVIRPQGRRVRYYLRLNAYEEQSYAKVSIWRDDAWHTIHHMAGETLKTRASYVDPNVRPEAFDEDIAELRRVAVAVMEKP